MTKVIVVTADDITVGIPRCGESCPIARALRRYTSERITVGIESVLWGDSGSPLRTVPLPYEAKQFIRNFDSRGLVDDTSTLAQPFQFELEVPEPPDKTAKTT